MNCQTLLFVIIIISMVLILMELDWYFNRIYIHVTYIGLHVNVHTYVMLWVCLVYLGSPPLAEGDIGKISARFV